MGGSQCVGAGQQGDRGAGIHSGPQDMDTCMGMVIVPTEQIDIVANGDISSIFHGQSCLRLYLMLDSRSQVPHPPCIPQAALLGPHHGRSL